MHTQGVIRVVWYGDVRIKQWVIIEFLVDEKESVTNFHNHLKNVFSVSTAYKSTVSL